MKRTAEYIDISGVSLKISTPHCEGPMETGVQLADTNNLMLYFQTTQNLWESRIMYYEAAFKYMMSKRFDYEGFKEIMIYDESSEGVMFAGMWILNDACHRLEYYTQHLYKRVLAQYEKEFGPYDWEDRADWVQKDFQNWLFREYEHWLGTKKKKLGYHRHPSNN